MKYAKLGNSDLNVSRICMRCMGFGGSVSESEIQNWIDGLK